jgi:hypothetical protein
MVNGYFEESKGEEGHPRPLNSDKTTLLKNNNKTNFDYILSLLQNSPVDKFVLGRTIFIDNPGDYTLEITLVDKPRLYPLSCRDRAILFLADRLSISV